MDLFGTKKSARRCAIEERLAGGDTPAPLHLWVYLDSGSGVELVPVQRDPKAWYLKVADILDEEFSLLRVHNADGIKLLEVSFKNLKAEIVSLLSIELFIIAGNFAESLGKKPVAVFIKKSSFLKAPGRLDLTINSHSTHTEIEENRIPTIVKRHIEPVKDPLFEDYSEFEI